MEGGKLGMIGCDGTWSACICIYLYCLSLEERDDTIKRCINQVHGGGISLDRVFRVRE